MAVLAVLEMGKDPLLLLVAAVFIVTFVAVCALGYALLGKRRREGHGSTWRVEFGARLPVSEEHSFQRIAETTRAAVSPPRLDPETRATLDDLASLRRGFVSLYRTVLIAAGLAGLIAGGLLLKSHTPANMNGLPGAIVCFLALGALMSGLVPGRSVKPIEPLDPELRRQMGEKINVQVITAPLLEVTLGASEIRRLSDMLQQGASTPDALRAVYPAFDTLGDTERRWLESTFEKHVRDLGRR